MESHTPGPWEIRRQREWCSEETYAQVWTPRGLLCNGVSCIPGEDREANARLIAASPDLLGALVRLATAVAEAIECDDPSALGAIVAGPMDDARAAIAKAGAACD
jgi:hypothetical protein